MQGIYLRMMVISVAFNDCLRMMMISVAFNDCMKIVRLLCADLCVWTASVGFKQNEQTLTEGLFETCRLFLVVDLLGHIYLCYPYIVITNLLTASLLLVLLPLYVLFVFLLFGLFCLSSLVELYIVDNLNRGDRCNLLSHADGTGINPLNRC